MSHVQCNRLLFSECLLATHRAQRSCSVIVASSPQSGHPVISASRTRRVHAGVSGPTATPVSRCLLVSVKVPLVVAVYTEEEQQSDSPSLRTLVASELQNEAPCSAERLLQLVLMRVRTMEAWHTKGGEGVLLDLDVLAPASPASPILIQTPSAHPKTPNPLPPSLSVHRSLACSTPAGQLPPIMRSPCVPTRPTGSSPFPG